MPLARCAGKHGTEEDNANYEGEKPAGVGSAEWSRTGMKHGTWEEIDKHAINTKG